MPKEKNNKKAIIFWALTALVMLIIFLLSSRNADESAEQSGYLFELIKKIFGDGFFTQHILRKLAHFCEFTLLCFLFNYSFFFTFNKPKRFLSFGLTSLYAATDEFHQLFVEGRSCELRDWAIDTSGALLGLIVFIVLRYIINKCIDRNYLK